ncbi:hypothetical protein TYRP_009148 [Tyrophagus putrescentiae]|nr:hypothetical protein TYRP_009148 [Tyrophagus putrescentiae]
MNGWTSSSWVSSTLLLIQLLVFTLFAVSSDARIHPAYLQEPGHCASPTDLRPRWMSRLADSRLLSRISMPGTHDSLALHGGLVWQCQSMPLAAQLAAGVRALDVRCRHLSGGRFAIYHSFNYQQIDFDGVLAIVAEFLAENPSETVLMRVKKEWISDPSFGGPSFEETFLRYRQMFNGLFYQSSEGGGHNGVESFNALTLGEVRGKVVVLQDFETSECDGKDVGLQVGNGGDEKLTPTHVRHHKVYGPLWSEAVIQDQFAIYTIWSMYYNKWVPIKEHLQVANDSLINSTAPNGPSPPFYINFLSASVGVMPYFAASGNVAWGTDGERQYFGLISGTSTHQYDDYPREKCVLDNRYCIVTLRA